MIQNNLPCHVSRVSHAREARRDLGQRKRNWQGPRKYAAKVAFHFWFVCSSLLSTLTASTAPSFDHASQLKQKQIPALSAVQSDGYDDGLGTGWTGQYASEIEPDPRGGTHDPRQVHLLREGGWGRSQELLSLQVSLIAAYLWRDNTEPKNFRAARYCNQTCQLADFKSRHKRECANFINPPTTSAFLVNPVGNERFPQHPTFAHWHEYGVGC